MLLRYDYCLFIMVVVRSLLFNWLATFCCYLILGFGVCCCCSSLAGILVFVVMCLGVG